MAFQRVIYVLKAIGIDGILRTIQYALYRDKADKQFSRKTIKSEALTPGKLTETIPIQGGFRLEYEYARAELVFLKPNLVRVSWEPGVPPVPYTIAKVDWDIVETKLEQTPDRTTISSENICIMLDTRGGIDFEDNAGHLLRRDSVPERDGDEWRLSTRLAHGEHLYGLGERDGALNLRPGRYTCWNSDPGGQHSHGSDLLYINTPILLSLSEAGCHVVYFENSYRSTFNIDKESQVTFPGGMLRYYVIFGSLEQVYRDLAELTGRPFLPPKWALGYHQSRWSYSSEEEVRKVVAGFEEHRLPISAIHLDIDYMDGFRVFTSNRRRFPDLKRLTHDLDEKGIKVVTILDPSVKRDPEYKVFTEGSKRDVFCKLPNGKTLSGVSWPGWCAFPDFTKAAARSWWKAQYPALLDQGIAGIWHDMNEPASFAAWGDKSLPQSTVHSMEEHGGSHAEAHNLYGMLMDQAGYEALSQYTSAKRPWILSRAGWAGSQRYAWNWSGDVETSWEGLRQTIPTLLGLGLSGHVFTGVDIGGFSGSPTAKLYRRWFQFATFLPFFRTHSAIGTQPRQPWVYGEPTTSILRKFLELRFQLAGHVGACNFSSEARFLQMFELLQGALQLFPEDLDVVNFTDDPRVVCHSAPAQAAAGAKSAAWADWPALARQNRAKASVCRA